MKKSIHFVLIALLAIAITACNSRKKARTDDDFYDFTKEETMKPKQQEPKTERDYEIDSESDYTPAKVSTREEKVEVVRGAVDYSAKYFIILGSFSQKENANKLVGRLAQQGFSPNILRAPSGLYRVSGYYFNEERAARIEVAQIRKKYPEYSDLWLLIKK